MYNCNMHEALEKLHTTLHEAGYSLTDARKAVFSALLDREPLTMNELVKAVGVGVNRASIYRIIELFERLGIVERLNIGWKYKLELTDAFSSHHHHMTCLKCGRVKSFEESPTISFELKQLAMEAGFTESGHQLEIRGLCQRCQS